MRLSHSMRKKTAVTSATARRAYSTKTILLSRKRSEDTFNGTISKPSIGSFFKVSSYAFGGTKTTTCHMCASVVRSWHARTVSASMYWVQYQWIAQDVPRLPRRRSKWGSSGSLCMTGRPKVFQCLARWWDTGPCGWSEWSSTILRWERARVAGNDGKVSQGENGHWKTSAGKTLSQCRQLSLYPLDLGVDKHYVYTSTLTWSPLMATSLLSFSGP